MYNMNESIMRFIEMQKCVSICCVDSEGNPYCFSCFYAFNAEEGLLYFKSSPATYHIKLLLQKPVVSGSILPDKLQILSVKGIQFQGVVLSEHHELSKNASTHYHKKYPFTLAIPGEKWTIQLTRIKMTDSSRLFGNKLYWERTEMKVL